jgi:pimeloyl-ACP methyl ester carboxylesterase
VREHKTARLGRRPTPYELLVVPERLPAARRRAGRPPLAAPSEQHTVHAQLFEHAGESAALGDRRARIRHGHARANFAAFRPAKLHGEQGYNVVLPSLPLHGLRGTGRMSGSEMLAPDYLRLVQLFAQAVWDVRRLIAWIRARGGTRIALYGLSLGAYVSALVTSLEDDLAGVIAGIPAVDFPIRRTRQRAVGDAPLRIRGGTSTGRRCAPPPTSCRRSRSSRACRVSAATSSRARPIAWRDRPGARALAPLGSLRDPLVSRAATSRRSGTPRSCRSSTARSERSSTNETRPRSRRALHHLELRARRGRRSELGERRLECGGEAVEVGQAVEVGAQADAQLRVVS